MEKYSVHILCVYHCVSLPPWQSTKLRQYNNEEMARFTNYRTVPAMFLDTCNTKSTPARVTCSQNLCAPPDHPFLPKMAQLTVSGTGLPSKYFIYLVVYTSEFIK